MSIERPLTILVATDGSEAAVAAAQRAVQLFGTGTHVVLAAVVEELEDPQADAGGFEGPVITEEQAEEQWEERRDDATEDLRHTAAALGSDVETQLIPSSSSPGPALVDLAGHHQVDVLVVGSTGKSTLRRLLSGSVSDYLVHHAPCPVLVVRDDHLHEPGS